MGHRLAALGITAALITALVLSATAGTVAAQATAPGLLLPNVTGTLARGGLLSGSVVVSRVTYRAGQLVADGTVSGTIRQEAVAPVVPILALPASTPTSSSSIFPSAATPMPTTEPVPTASDVTTTALSTSIGQGFRDIPVTIVDPDMGTCDYLHVDLGTIFLDQLGVQLDLAPAMIDLQALPRANRPVGNLLCTVASLMEVTPGTRQAATLNELLPVVNRTLATAAR